MEKQGETGRRPAGYSSRVKLGAGKKSTWTAPNGQKIRLPLIVDQINIDPKSGNQTWCIEAQVDLIDGIPCLTEVHLRGQPNLDPILLQRFFRWATPLEVVRVLIPNLLERGINPLQYEFPTDGYPDSATIDRKPNNRLTDDFLKEVARQYMEVGHGYARTIAEQRGVSSRTVVSWVEKARKRGFIARTTPGRRNRRPPTETARTSGK